MNSQGEKVTKKKSVGLMSSCILIAIASFVITFGICEIIYEIKAYGIIFTVWAVLLIIGFLLLVPCYLKKLKDLSVSKEAVGIFGICFIMALIYVLLLLYCLAERNNINGRGSIVFLLFIGISGSSVISWLISDGILSLYKREILYWEGYKALIDYLSFALTVLSFIFLILPNLDAQVDVSTFGTFGGGVICFYDLLLGLADDIRKKHKSDKSKGGAEKGDYPKIATDKGVN